MRVLDLHRRVSADEAVPPEAQELSMALVTATETLEQSLSGALEAAGAAEAGPAAAREGVTEAAARGAAEDDGVPAEVALARKLPAVREAVERDALAVDAADCAFVDKAAAILEGMDAADRSGEKGARMLVDCVRFLDAIERDYSLPGYGRLMEAVARARRELARHLKAERGVVFDPDPAADDAEAGTSGASPLDALDALDALGTLEGAKQVPFPSTLPRGTVLSLLKRGVSVRTSEGVRSETPEVLVSDGKGTAAFDLADAAVKALLRPGDPSAQARQAKAAAYKEARRKYLPQLVGADAEKETVVLRYVLNLMQPFDRGTALRDAVDSLLAALRDRGLNLIPVKIGAMFDDSFGLSKYERKKVPSDKPPGTIVQVMQRGFVNREGVPVQKAIVGVSGS